MEIDGPAVLTGATPVPPSPPPPPPLAVTWTPFEVAVALPPLLAAVTSQASVWSTSSFRTAYVDPIAPGMGAKSRSQRKLYAGPLVQVPGLQVSTWPGVAPPLTVG